MTPADVALLAQPQLQDLLRKHAGERPERFAFAIGKDRSLPGLLLTEQLACRNKVAALVPEWSGKDLILPPEAMVGSGACTRWLAGELARPGLRVVDPAAGLGVAALHLAAAGASVTAAAAPLAAACLRHNAAVLGISLDVRDADAVDLLTALPDAACDLLLARPAPGRGPRPGLDDFRPHLGSMLGQARRVAATSRWLMPPGSDVAELCSRWVDLTTLFAVSVAGELQELHLVCDHRSAPERPQRVAVRLDRAGAEVGRIAAHSGHDTPAQAAQPLGWLHEPDPAVVRLELVADLAAAHGLSLLHPALSFLTSAGAVAGFPGRSLRLLHWGAYERRTWRDRLRCQGIRHANATCRQFPHSAPDVLDELGLRAGGQHELWCWRDAEGRPWCALGVRDRAPTEGTS